MISRVLLILAMLLVLDGCSSRDAAIPPINITESSDTMISEIIGAYELVLNPKDLTADLVPKRISDIGESFIVSGKSFFDVFPCRDCFQFYGLGYENGKLLVDFRIRHPFPKGDPGQAPSGKNRLDLDLFDLAIVVVPDSQTPTKYELTNVEVYDGFIADPDGFTKDLANLIGDPAAMPYKLVIDNSIVPPSNTYNKFEMGSEKIVQIKFPVESSEILTFDLYLTAGYGASAKLTERLTPQYFNPEFNRKAAWKVEVTPPNGTNPPAHGNTWDSDDSTTPYNVTVKVYDWQIGANVNPALENPTDVIAESNVSSVRIEIPGMNDTIPQVAGNSFISGTGMPDSPLIYNVPVINEKSIAAGVYMGIVEVVDVRSPEPVSSGHDFLVDSPNGKVIATYEIPVYATYQTFTATVVPGTGSFNVQDITPPYMNFSPRDVWIDGNYAYVAASSNGMHIFNISNPAVAPVWVGRYKSAYPVYGVAAANGYACITSDADGYTGMTILDVSNPANPTVVKYIDIDQATPYDVFIKNGYAYLVAWNEGLYIIDIDPPSSASIVKTVASPASSSCSDVFVSGNYAYLCCGFPGLAVIDITDPSTASVVKTIDTFNAQGVRVKNGYAFVTEGVGGMAVIDLEPLDTASVVQTLYIANGLTDGIDISGNYAYLPAYGQGVKVVDISAPESSNVVQTVFTPATSNDVAISGNRAFVTDSTAGLFLLDITTPTSASLSTQVDTIGWGTGMSVDGNYAYVANYNAGLSIVDISNISQPRIIKTLDPAGQLFYPAFDIAVKNGFAYLAVGNDGLYVIDVDPPEDANVVTKVPTTTDMHSVTIDGDYAYLGNGDFVTIVDISTPGSSAVVKQVNVSGNVYDVSVRNGYAYTANLGGGGFSVVDIDPVDSAFLVKTVGCANSRRATAIDGYAFITGFPGMKIFDVEPADSTSLVTTFSQTPGDDFYGITVSGNYLFTGVNKDAGERALFILDITDPTAPSITVDFPVSGMVNDLEVIDNYAFLSHEQAGGFSILKLW